MNQVKATLYTCRAERLNAESCSSLPSAALGGGLLRVHANERVDGVPLAVLLESGPYLHNGARSRILHLCDFHLIRARVFVFEDGLAFAWDYVAAFAVGAVVIGRMLLYERRNRPVGWWLLVG